MWSGELKTTQFFVSLLYHVPNVRAHFGVSLDMKRINFLVALVLFMWYRGLVDRSPDWFIRYGVRISVTALTFLR